MKLKLKRFDLYTILTFVALGLAAIFIHDWRVCVPVCLALVAQYEFTYINMCLILAQYKLLKRGKIDKLSLSKFQSWMRRVFAI